MSTANRLIKTVHTFMKQVIMKYNGMTTLVPQGFMDYPSPLKILEQNL
jgi:hypothetical protein